MTRDDRTLKAAAYALEIAKSNVRSANEESRRAQNRALEAREQLDRALDEWRLEVDALQTRLT